ncbi:hypothetical protein P8C59_005087 [Phyllachora maydis]|uniref:tRNA-splicing endonuclease subunit Sen15 domain-containing protein n=1 Tax=Phyllachora maydis TaxID=1825666 RepID=A0AAD9MBW4_9PEZI|nr:hypothetical protein P8C59_005087 [Phyllachora maydis]
MEPREHTQAFARTVLHNLEHQQDWTQLTTHTRPVAPDGGPGRPLLAGLPPRRLYTHPDEQLELIKAERALGRGVAQPPEVEWVLPTHVAETWTLRRFAAVFDALDGLPPGAPEADAQEEGAEPWMRWRGTKRGKRLLLAIVQDDSTVVYYLMHDGVVKPRPN